MCHDLGHLMTRAPSASPPVPSRPLPPGPPLPRALQTAGFLFGGARFLEACRRRYGDAVTFGTLFDERFVMVFDPDLVKEVFRGSGAQLHAGEANALLGPILGERSVLLLDGDEHLRHRRLLLPPFHGERMLAHTETMRACTDEEIDRWPVGEPFALLATPAVAHPAGDPARRVRLRARSGRGGAPRPAAGDGRAPRPRPRGLLMVVGAAAGSRGPPRGAGVRGPQAGGRRDPLRRDRPPARAARPRPSATTCSPRCCWPATSRADGSPTARCATSC